MSKPVGKFGVLMVEPDLSGGVRVKFGDAMCVLAPDEAVKFFAAGLRCAGCNVDFAEPAVPAVIKRAS